LCDGTSVRKTQYPALYEALGNLYGDNSTHFFLPDYRGTFLRGVATSSTQDPDYQARTPAFNGSAFPPGVGSTQADEFKSHNHGNGDYNRLLKLNTVNAWTFQVGDKSTNEPNLVESAVLQNAGGNETRPKNIAVYYIIKAH